MYARIWIRGHGPADFMQDHKECDVSRTHHHTCKRIENSKAVDLADILECRFQSVKNGQKNSQRLGL